MYLADGLRLDGEPLAVSQYNWHTVLYSSPEHSITSLIIQPGQHSLWHIDKHVGFSVVSVAHERPAEESVIRNHLPFVSW